MKPSIVGLDLDNTLVCYDQCFHVLARRNHAMPDTVPVAKNAVRQFFRDDGRESEWTVLQGIAYGTGMQEAEPFAGALEFVREAVGRGIPLKIISHRTKFPIVGDRTDLHASAREWLRAKGFIDRDALSESDVYFEISKEDKLRRIGEQGCCIFLDDLPEILDAALFPSSCEGWLFAPNGPEASRKSMVRDWASFSRIVL